MQEEELFQAVTRNDIETAKAVLRPGVDVNSVLPGDHADYPGYGVLHVAVR